MKKTYIIPSVEQVRMMHRTNLLSGSGASHDKQQTLPGTPIDNGQLG